MSKKNPKAFQDLLNMDRVLKSLDKNDNLKVTLKRTTIKGIGLYAIKPIKKDETIAYYKFTVFLHDKYKSPTHYVYTVDVYTKKGNEHHKYIGDIDYKSIPNPLNDIPFWGMFTNEPSKGQTINAEMDMNIDFNYKNRNIVKPGSTMVYEIVATRNIKPTEEIVWDYGPDYLRDYEVGK